MSAMNHPTDIGTRAAVPSDIGSATSRYHGDGVERRGPGLFPAGALNTPMFEGKDIAGFVAAVTITLGPLAAYSLGWGA